MALHVTSENAIACSFWRALDTCCKLDDLTKNFTENVAVGMSKDNKGPAVSEALSVMKRRKRQEF